MFQMHKESFCYMFSLARTLADITDALFKLLDWTALHIYATAVAKCKVYMCIYILSTCLLLCK